MCIRDRRRVSLALLPIRAPFAAVIETGNARHAKQHCVQRYQDVYKRQSQVCDLAPYREEAKDVAQRNHWNFREVPGDIIFLARLLDGDFREEEVLLCPPGKTVTPSYDAKKLTFL